MSSTGNFSTITLNHTKKLKLEILEDGNITPLGLQMTRFKGLFLAFSRFQKSAGSGRQCGDNPPGGNFHAGRSSYGSLPESSRTPAHGRRRLLSWRSPHRR